MNSIYLMVLAWCAAVYGVSKDWTWLKAELDGFRIIQNNYLTLGEYGSLWDFSPEFNLPHLYFQIYAFKTVYNIPCALSSFWWLGSLGISFKLLLMLVTCFLSFFSHEKFVNFMDLFKESVFVSLILSMNLMFFLFYWFPFFIIFFFCFQSFSNFFKNWRALLNLFLRSNTTLTTMRTL